MGLFVGEFQYFSFSNNQISKAFKKEHIFFKQYYEPLEIHIRVAGT